MREGCELAHVAEGELEVKGVLESQIAELVEEVSSLDQELYVKSMAGGGRIRIYVRAKSRAEKGAKELLDVAISSLKGGILKAGGRVIRELRSDPSRGRHVRSQARPPRP